MEQKPGVKEPAVDPGVIPLKKVLLPPPHRPLLWFYLCVKAFLSAAAGLQLKTALHSGSFGPAASPVKAVG